jgi:hypothetical protein
MEIHNRLHRDAVQAQVSCELKYLHSWLQKKGPAE